MQLDMEKYYETLSLLTKQNVIIICDWGTCDNFAYCSQENKQTILKDNNWSNMYLSHSRYDMVLHIMSASIGAEDMYSNNSNKNRYEQIEFARILD